MRCQSLCMIRPLRARILNIAVARIFSDGEVRRLECSKESCDCDEEIDVDVDVLILFFTELAWVYRDF